VITNVGRPQWMQLETQEGDLTHALIVPIFGEAESIDVEAQRALGVLDEEDASAVEVVHLSAS